MQNRLCGREQEFALRVSPTLPESPIILPNMGEEWFQRWRGKLVELIIKKVHSLPIFSLNVTSSQAGFQRLWMENGSLVYIDLSCILEWATAEYRACSFEGIMQEKASELILNEALTLVREEEGFTELALYKNNVGPSAQSKDIYQEVTYASHHNYSYLTARRKEVFNLFKNFIPVFLPFSGNGHIYRHSGTFFYTLSQRAPHIIVSESTTTTQQRAIVNNRDESLMSKKTGLSRLHLIAQDSTRCEFQTWLVDSVNHLVLRLAEEGWELPATFALHNAVKTMRDVNYAMSVDFDYPVAGIFFASKTPLLDYNALFLNAAKQLSPLSPEEKKCLEEWERVLGLLKAKAYDQLIGELDWVTKWYLLQNKIKKAQSNLGSIESWRINTEYHNISSSPDQSWYARLDDLGYIRHLVSFEDIQKAVTEPPATRAKSRGRFIEMCNKYDKLRTLVTFVQWEEVKFGLPPTDFSCYFGEEADPFICESSTLERLYGELGITE